MTEPVPSNIVAAVAPITTTPDRSPGRPDRFLTKACLYFARNLIPQNSNAISGTSAALFLEWEQSTSMKRILSTIINHIRRLPQGMYFCRESRHQELRKNNND
jgi:hypothetical protein